MIRNKVVDYGTLTIFVVDSLSPKSLVHEISKLESSFKNVVLNFCEQAENIRKKRFVMIEGEKEFPAFFQ